MAEGRLSVGGSFKEQFDDQLTCSVCLDQYTNPKTLPCHHSFCLKCIQPLPTIIQEGSFYISCPTCRDHHPVSEGGATNLPNAFQINSLLDLRRKMTITETNSVISCPKHNDTLKVYCETCRQVICRDCTISKEHNTHKYELICECYPKHNQQIEASFDQVKHKKDKINAAVTYLDTTEKKVIEKGEELQEQINTHAQQIIDQVERSRECLSQQLHNIVKQKTHLLTAQKQQAQKLHTQLNTCQEMIEHSLKELTQLQILTEKHTMINQMNTATQHVDPTVFLPIETAGMQFTKSNLTAENGIGYITSNTYGLITSTAYEKATLNVLPCLAKRPSTATLALHSQDGSPFPLPPSLISSTLYSPGDKHSVKCDITQTHQTGKYNITFTPCTRQDQLIVQVGGVDIPDSPFTLPVIPTPEMRGEPINIISGLINPFGIAVSNNGDIIVAERGRNRITILNKKGKKLKSFGTEGTKEGQFNRPRGVAVSTHGHVLVTDKHRLQKVTTDGVCVKLVGSSDSGSGQLQFNTPTGITVHPTTRQIFVADSENNRIQVFNDDLTFSHTIAPSGFNIKLCHPFDVALDNEGYLYVAEFSHGCITKISRNGKFVKKFRLSLPMSITIHNGLVYVSQFGNNCVSIFDTNGTFINCRIGTVKMLTAKLADTIEPINIAINSLGNMYVSDVALDRIIVF